jgi:ribosomal protein L14E/L6E/L27E
MKTKGIYLYAIVPNSYSEEMFKSIENIGIYLIPYKNLFAIASDRDEHKIEQLDRQELGHLLVDHQKKIEYFQKVGFSMLLPMQMGTFSQSKAEVCTILQNGYDLILASLQKINNLTEFNVAAVWADFSKTLGMVAAHPEISAMRDKLIEKTEKPTEMEQVAIGIKVQEELINKNSQVALNIVDSLASICIDKRTHDTMNDEMVLNSAFLIEKNNTEKFEETINQLDKDYNETLNFKLIGPLPCYSFYTIEVKRIDHLQVIQAEKALGLTKESSQGEIKKAYQEKAKELHPDSNQKNINQESFTKINKAYKMLLEYSEVARGTSTEHVTSQQKQNDVEDLILVKIKE